MRSDIETSIIIPVYNEISYIADMLNSLIINDYPKDKLEILIYDGLSTDGTDAILEEYSNRFPYIKCYKNPHRLQVYALNLALKIVAGKFIIRCDAHASYPSNYISTLITYLHNADERVGNIGGQAITLPGTDSSEAKAIALALNHPFGVGLSHRSLKIDGPKEVDTVLFGAWRKEVFDRVGGFDELFIRGQDYEHNKRLKNLGYQVLLLPNLQFKYYTRTNSIKLCRMVYQYAYAKAQIIKKYNELPNTRILIPAFFLLGLMIAPFYPILYWGYIIYFLLLIGILYNINAIKSIKFYLFFIFPAMHIAHGFGFIRGLIEQFIFKKSNILWDTTR